MSKNNMADINTNTENMTFTRRADRKVDRKRRDPAYTLRLLREALGLTQVQMSEKSGITQSELSKIERRADARVSTLESYASALGGKLELRVVFEDRSYKLTLVDERDNEA